MVGRGGAPFVVVGGRAGSNELAIVKRAEAAPLKGLRCLACMLPCVSIVSRALPKRGFLNICASAIH